MSRKWMYGLLVAFWAVIAVATIAGSGQTVVLCEKVVALNMTDTCVDSMTGTVTAGAVSQKGLRVNGAAFATYLPILAAAGNVYFDTAVMQILSHPTGFAVTTKTRTATVCRITVTGGHFDSLYGTIMAATDSITLDFDSTGKTRRHIVGTCDSAISATVVALKIANAIVAGNADSFFVGWTCTPKAYHARITDYADSVATHAELDTTWGNRSYDSLFMHTQRTHPVTGWTFHGLKRGGHITDTVWVSRWIENEPGMINDFFLRCFSFSNLESTMVKVVVYTQCVGSDTGRRVEVCSMTAADTTTDLANWTHFPQLADADSAIAKGGHLCNRYQVVVTVTDSNSLPADYGRYTAVGIRVVKKTI